MARKTQDPRQNPTQKKPLQTLVNGPLSASDLRHLALRQQLPAFAWRRLTLTFDQNRELFEVLNSPDLPHRRGIPRNPFLAALRRLRREADTTELPLRHRQALARLDSPLALARLALEEANTRAWRQLDLLPLQEMVRWFCQGPLGRGAAAAELHARALTYHAYYLPREGRHEEGLDALYAMTFVSPRIPTDHDLVFALLLATALCWAPVNRADPREPAGEAHAGLGTANKWQEVNLALISAEMWLSKNARPSESPELRAELALVRGALYGLDGDHLLAEAVYREAFAFLLPDQDPFLRLMLCQEAAAALVNAGLSQLELPGSPLALLAWEDALPSTAMHTESSADRLASEILATVDGEVQRFEQAAAWLERAAPLLARHGNTEQRIRQQWLGAVTRQFAEPDFAFLELIAAFKKAHEHGRLVWLAPMANDLLLLAPRLRELTPRRRRQILRHLEPVALWLATSLDFGPTRHAARPHLEPAQA